MRSPSLESREENIQDETNKDEMTKSENEDKEEFIKMIVRQQMDEKVEALNQKVEGMIKDVLANNDD
jgi:hypothetical protein